MMSKWILRGAAVASMLMAYDCRSRRRDDDNSSNNSTTTNNNTTAQQPVAQPPVAQPQQGMQPVAPPPVQPQQGMQPMQPMQPAGGDFIASQMQMRQQQFATGMNPVLPLTRGTLPTGGTQNYAVTMVQGQCYKIIGVGGPGVTDLDLVLYDPQNNQVDQDIATDNFPVIGLQRQLCPTAAGQYRLEVKMFAGAGDYGVQVFGR